MTYIIPETNGFVYEINHVAKLFGVIKDNDKIGKKFAKYLKDSPVYNETIQSIKFKYYDVKNTEQFLNYIKKGYKKIIIFDNVELSLWAKLGMTRYRFGDIIGKIEPQKEAIEIFMKTVMDRRIKLKCTYCGNVWFVKLSDVEEHPKCPKCKSPMIGFAGVFREGNFYKNDDDDIKKSALIIRGYGKRALIALSIYGIGPKTAARVLRKMRTDDKQFFVDLVDAQKAFIKNKRFWTV